MGSYTITFAPDDVANASAVVRVDLGVAGARITELTVRAGNGDGLVPGELPGFDLGRLLRAIAPAGPAAPAFELTPATIASYAEPVAASATRRAGASTERRASTSTATNRAATGRATAKQTAAKQAPAKKSAGKAASRGGRVAKTVAGSAASRSATRATKRAAATAATRSGQGTSRAYRRTPDDIVEVFTQAPSATALARHYGVPRHTVQGWLRRLRSEGILPPSSRSAA